MKTYCHDCRYEIFDDEPLYWGDVRNGIYIREVPVCEDCFGHRRSLNRITTVLWTPVWIITAICGLITLVGLFR